MSAMTKTWTNYFLVKLPVALAVVVVSVQLLAHALANVPLRRFEYDRFPEAIANDQVNHAVILLGDSTTRNATRFYNVGDERTVLNLSTHAFFSLVGEALLVRRYLETHRSPILVELVATPTLFTGEIDVEKAHYYLWRVFP
jgi:hypothetical protein